LQNALLAAFPTPGAGWGLFQCVWAAGEASGGTVCSVLDFQEPSNKRVRPLARVTSLANLISPVRNGAVRRFGQTIQVKTTGLPLRNPEVWGRDGLGMGEKGIWGGLLVKIERRRDSKVTWSRGALSGENLALKLTLHVLSPSSQAIYEMSRGEQDLIEDLKLARKAYHDPMLKLSIMSEEELTHIFGDLDSYIPLHEDLLASLGEATKPDGTVEQIGPILVKWLPRLHAYKGYCSNQLAAKALLDQKKQDRRVQDFLQRCLESPFSRKLDLWSFLDIPRSRLVKYPLLLKEILRHTPKDHPDIHILEEAISIIQGVLSDINLKKGESECQYYIDKLEYLDEKQKDPRIEGSKALLCHGELKNKNGHKLYVFLFQDILVLTRPVTRNERQAFQVYRQPIPAQELLLEDLQDGDVKMGGSFRGAFGNSDKAKNIFRVRFREAAAGQAHTLQANDVFHKQQWVSCIRGAVAPFQSSVPPAELQELPELGEENDPAEAQPERGTAPHGPTRSREKQLSGKRKETLV
ncbi:ARHG8 protein, partial [Mionectes macconnelli]|nr:ARHG8 protein [Mionectes macconnelli]